MCEKLVGVYKEDGYTDGDIVVELRGKVLDGTYVANGGKFTLTTEAKCTNIKWVDVGKPTHSVIADADADFCVLTFSNGVIWRKQSNQCL